MKHEEVYKQFRKLFPEIAAHVGDWFPNGRNSVRIRIRQGTDFIFNYRDNYTWNLETVDSYINRIKKGGAIMNA